MHTVIETAPFLKAAAAEGFSDNARADLVEWLARHPAAGDLIPGTGGARKVRFAGRGKGKSGGYRVITFYGGDDIPVFLIGCFGKGSRANLTQAERNEMRAALTRLPAAWRRMMKDRLKVLAGRSGARKAIE